MTAIVGRGVRIEVAATYAAAITVTAISQAKPGVATAAAHGLVNGAVGHFTSVEGMVQLENQAARVANQATNTFELQGLSTLAFPAFTGSALFTPVSTWQTIGIATAYNIGGGEADKLDNTTLLDDIKQELNGLLAAQTVGFSVNAETFNSAAMDLVEDAARANSSMTFRITLKDGSTRVFRGEPSLPGEDVQKGSIGTGQFSVTVKGFVVKTPA